MAFKLLIKPISLLDAEEAVQYYENRLQGLGKRFYLNFLSTIEKLQSSPNNYAFVKEPVRRIRIEKFPYKIFYFVENDTIIILGVSHTKRSNAFIKRRIRLLK